MLMLIYSTVFMFAQPQTNNKAALVCVVE